MQKNNAKYDFQKALVLAGVTGVGLGVGKNNKTILKVADTVAKGLSTCANGFKQLLTGASSSSVSKIGQSILKNPKTVLMSVVGAVGVLALGKIFTNQAYDAGKIDAKYEAIANV